MCTPTRWLDCRPLAAYVAPQVKLVNHATWHIASLWQLGSRRLFHTGPFLLWGPSRLRTGAQLRSWTWRLYWSQLVGKLQGLHGDVRQLDDDRRFSSSWIVQASKARLAALYMQDVIFSKGLYHLYVQMCEAYYWCTLTLPDLSHIEALDVVQHMTDDDFKTRVRGTYDMDPPFAVPLEDTPEELLPLPQMPNTKAVVPEVITLAVVSKAGPGEETVKILFDNFTHCSGRLRAFVPCRRHDRCRLYKFVDRCASKLEKVCLVLAAWVAGRHHYRIPELHDAHRKHTVPAENVAKWREIIGEVPEAKCRAIVVHMSCTCRANAVLRLC